MASEAGTVWHHGRRYFLGNVVTRLAGLILLPIYARVLTPVEFGVYALVTVAVDVLIILVGFRIDFAMIRVYLDDEDENRRRRVVAVSVMAFGTIALTYLCLAGVLFETASLLMLGDRLHAATMAAAMASVVFVALFNFELSYLRMRKLSGAFLLVSAVKSVLLLGANVLFVVVWQYGVLGIFLGTLVAFSALTLIVLCCIVVQNGLSLSRGVLVDLLRISLPALPASLMDAAASGFDRYVLNAFLSTRQVGVYSLGWRLAQLLQMFVWVPFRQIWLVRRLETFKETHRHDELARVHLHFFAVLVYCGLGLSVLAPEVIRVVATSAYAEAAAAIPFLATAFVLVAVQRNWEIGIVQVKRATLLPLISAASLATGAVLVVTLVWAFGMIGAAIAAALTQAVRAAMTGFLSLRVCPQQPGFDLGRMAALYLVAAAFYCVAAAFADRIDVVSTVTKLALLVVFPVVIYRSSIIGEVGRAELRALLRRARLGPGRRAQGGRNRARVAGD